MTAGATGELIKDPLLLGRGMAKRKYSVKRMPKVQPAPLKLNYEIAAGNNTSFIDLARDASRLGRRFIRQGKVFAIGNIRVTMASASTPTAGSSVYISTMQNTWTVSNAWHKSFAMWQKQSMEAIEDAGAESVVARFRDFKVFMDNDHFVTGNLDPVNLGPFLPGPFPTAVVTTPGPLPSEDWDYSRIVIPNDGAPGVTNEYNLIMHGSDTTAVKAMAAGYQASRSIPQTPDPATPSAVEFGWMAEMFDVGDDSGDVLDLAQYNNRELPYDQIDYPGTPANYAFPENKAWCFNRSTTGVNTFNLGGMVAPCGLLRIDQLYSEGSPTNLIIEIELLPGNDKGYALANMQDM